MNQIAGIWLILLVTWIAGSGTHFVFQYLGSKDYGRAVAQTIAQTAALLSAGIVITAYLWPTGEQQHRNHLKQPLSRYYPTAISEYYWRTMPRLIDKLNDRRTRQEARRAIYTPEEGDLPFEIKPRCGGVLGAWLVRVGEEVIRYTPLVDLDQYGMPFTLDAPVSGTLVSIVAEEGERVEKGDIIGWIRPHVKSGYRNPTPRKEPEVEEIRIEPKKPYTLKGVIGPSSHRIDKGLQQCIVDQAKEYGITPATMVSAMVIAYTTISPAKQRAAIKAYTSEAEKAYTPPSPTRTRGRRPKLAVESKLIEAQAG